ncbi:hypothetical protein O3G_MSEX015163 [Manduca sexta]|uniref:Uncharacterized protein n=1 Tax=Manduca sexta TaxID=7130 RepID=A0A921ZYN6_MANSE|nr:hypothetical protein O3G_MSEX015163 [Manduca sexta]
MIDFFFNLIRPYVLSSRLEAYDRNFNFSANPGPSTSLSDPQYLCPPISAYKDINADSPIPPLNRQEIQSFFERFNTRPKGKVMYEARCLLTARYVIEGVNTYIQSQCKAQMKKMIYIVNVMLNNEGNIIQSHCERAAGSGIEAHCKHVSVLLRAIEDMIQTKSIILHQVSTQTLMTFKKPSKVFYKSPIQAQNLPSISKKRKSNINFEPLPKELEIENYHEYVCNLAINFGETKMPILQLIRPANPYGMDYDHNMYSCKTMQDHLLDNLLLQNVTQKKIMK